MSVFVRTPLTDVGGTLFTHQSHNTCNDFEMRYINCMEAYGYSKGTRNCTDFFDDLKECTTQEKRKARIIAMWTERRRQMKAGETTYSDPPCPDII